MVHVYLADGTEKVAFWHLLGWKEAYTVIVADLMRSSTKSGYYFIVFSLAVLY
jgi:hypothetical protein